MERVYFLHPVNSVPLMGTPTVTDNEMEAIPCDGSCENAKCELGKF